MKILCPVGIGELIDKISILEIKKIKITDVAKNAHICNELSELKKLVQGPEFNGVSALLAELIQVNTELWEIEDLIRICEKKNSFDQDFIKLARSVYMKNDLRFEIKNKINELFKSEFIEVKSYEKYV